MNGATSMTNKSMQPIGMGEVISPSESLPMHVAKQWGFPFQWHEREGVVWYSIRDWIFGLTGSTGRRAKEVWNAYKRRSDDKRWGVTSRVLPYRALDGRIFEMDFTTDEGLYKLAMMLRVTKERQSLRDIKDFLAKAGVFVDEARRDPETASERLAIARRNQAVKAGQSEGWIADRELSVITRKQFVARVYHLTQEKETFGRVIGTITNDVYRGVFDADVNGLRERLGISFKENPRDHFSRIALAYTTIAEESIRIHLDKYADTEYVSFVAMRRVAESLAGAIGVQVDVIANALQIDPVSGRKLDDKPLTKGQFENLLTAAAQPKRLKPGGQSRSQT
ncbi:MAG: hypothetical protein HW388_1490 [Dehalococcoidia bacterium]|nr:hypothetical protein [Dehalococcoidia bacterium]